MDKVYRVTLLPRNFYMDSGDPNSDPHAKQGGLYLLDHFLSSQTLEF